MKIIELIKVVDCDYNNTGGWCEYFQITSKNYRLSLDLFSSDIEQLKKLGFKFIITGTKHLHFY